MNHLKKYITIYNPLYTAITTVCTSGLILISNGTIATTVVVVIAIGIHTIVNKGKDKLSEIDESSPIGKLKKQNEEYKNKISEKEAMLIALRAELINYTTTNKRTKKEAEQMLNGLLNWCGEAEGMNTINCENKEETTAQREKIKSFLVDSD